MKKACFLPIYKKIHNTQYKHIDSLSAYLSSSPMPVSSTAAASPQSVRSMELLAPVGTLPAFVAALDAGADAVYVGAPGLNARALSRDFTMAELMAMIDLAHERGKKLYMALNSLLKEEEIQPMLHMLGQLKHHPPDALIIQDAGLLHLLKGVLPDTAIHASTLMGINNSLGAEFCRAQGFERVVLARELSLGEIATIHQQSDIQLEIFVHGAMCFSYSGLCRFSSLHGGRSSLRGRCVQPCRRRYAWAQGGGKLAADRKKSSRNNAANATQAGGHFFSMSDLCGINHLAAIRKSGVVSLKIEGRLRPVAYVAHTVRAYRLALDSLDAAPKQRAEMMAEARACLKKAMARRLTSGFLIADPEEHKKIILPHLSGSAGELVGRTVLPERGRKGAFPGTGSALQVVLQADVRLGDRLRFYEKKSGDRLSFTLRYMESKGKVVKEARSGQTVRLADPALESLPGEAAKAQGLLFRVDVASRREGISPELARRIAAFQHKQPEPARQRQSSADTLVANANEGARKSTGNAKKMEWWLHVSSVAVYRALRLPFSLSRLLIDLNPDNMTWFTRQRSPEKQSPPLIWALPPLILEQHLAWYREAICLLRERGAAAFQIGHFSQMALFLNKGHGVPEGLELYGDYSLNVLNSGALRFWADQGLSGLQFCLETDRHNLLAALDQARAAWFLAAKAGEKNTSKPKMGVLAYGRPPLFVARLDAPHFQGKRGLVSARGERYYLERGFEFLALRSAQAFTLLLYLGELQRSGLDYMVVDLRYGQPKQEAAVVAGLLRGKDDPGVYCSGNYAETLV